MCSGKTLYDEIDTNEPEGKHETILSSNFRFIFD